MRLGMYRDLERKPTTVSKNLMIQTKAKFYWRMILLAKKYSCTFYWLKIINEKN